MPPFDPASCVAQRFCDADVVVLALRDVQDFALLVAVCRLSPAVKGKEFGVRLGALGLVTSDGIVERQPQPMRIRGVGRAVGVGHRNQPESGAQTGQRLD